MLVDPGGVARADAVGLQEDHDRADLLLLVPGLLDHPDPLRADPLDLGELLDIALDDVEGLLLEPLDDPLGHDRADPLDQPRAEVFLDPGDRGGDGAFAEDDLELLAVLGMAAPFALHREDLAGGGVDDMADDGDQFLAAVDLHPGDGEAVLVVGVGDPLDLAAELRKVVVRHGHRFRLGSV